MYKKRKMISTVIAAVAVLFAVIFLFGMQLLKKQKEEQRVKPEENIQKFYEVLLYKSSAGTITFEEAWLKSDEETECILSVEAGTLVQLSVSEDPGKVLEDVEVLDYSFQEINSIIHDGADGKKKVDFVMPQEDVLINFSFSDVKEETEELTEEEVPQTESESEEMRYPITLHGLSAGIITSYEGLFDDRDFIRQFGDSLRLHDPSSPYADVTDVTFTEEEVKKEEGTVRHVIYLNETEDRKMVSVFYKKDGIYVFTEYEGEEIADTQTEEITGGMQQVYVEDATSEERISVETSFDILQVSKNLLEYAGGEETFYQKTFDYVLESGLSGEIVGTMTGYEILPEEKKAVFQILLNTGKEIKGEYDKKKKTYAFSGL